MKKISFLTGIFVFCLFAVSSFVQPAPAEVADAGNAYCPVSGDKVSRGSFVEYEGKKYGLCCQICDRQFLKDPEKYVTAMEEKEAAAAEEGEGEDTGHEHHAH